MRFAGIGMAMTAIVAAVDAQVCQVSDFSYRSWPTAADSVQVIGSGFDLNRDRLVLRPNGGGADVDPQLMGSGSPSAVTFNFTGLAAGNLYRAVFIDKGTSLTSCEMSLSEAALVQLPPTLSTFVSNSGTLDSSSRYNVAGKRSLQLQGSFPQPMEDSDVIVRYENLDGSSVGLDTEPGQVRLLATGNGFVIDTVTPAVPTEADWLLNCTDPANPVRSSTCVPDIDLQISVSIDRGLSWSNAVLIKFGYVPAVKVAFVMVGPVNDFGWTFQINEGRVQLEKEFGTSVDASFYVENVEEGEFETNQDNLGRTAATNTDVPETFQVEGMTVKNLYYKGATLLKELCDQDYDVVFTCSFGFQTQTWDISGGYRGCQVEGSDGQAAKNTHFINTGGYLTNPRMSTGFGKIYQMRYLTGLVAGNELKTRRLAKEIEGTWDPSEPMCVGYIAAYPLPEVQRGINAFLVGCRKVYPECIVRVAWSGVWGNDELEREAAAFMYNVGKCEVITQHSDTTSPQEYYKERGGVGIGYNSDTRRIVGDSVLVSSLLNWAPVFGHFVAQVRDGKWDVNARSVPGNEYLQEQLWPGVAEGAVKLSEYFSPLVPSHVQSLVQDEMQTLQQATGDDAFKFIFCGDLKARWVYKSPAPGQPRAKGCGFQPEWVRLDTPKGLNPKHFKDKNTGTHLTTEDNITASACLYGLDPALGGFPGQALLATAFVDGEHDEDKVFSDYLLEGVELFDPQTTSYGTIHGPEDEDHGCVSEFGSKGDRFYAPPKEYPRCDGTQWKIRRGTCNPETSRSEVEYYWATTETGEELECGTEVDDVTGKYLNKSELPLVADEDAPPCDYVAYMSISGVTVLGLAAFGVLMNGSFALLILKYRKNNEVRKTQPLLVNMMALGGVILNVSTVLFLGEATDVSCLLRVWLFNLAFDFVFAVLWARIYRVYVLFSNAKKVRRVVIKDTDMLRVAGLLVFVDALILLVWSILDPSRPMVTDKVFIELPAPALGEITYTECSSTSDAYGTATLVFKVILVLSACVLVFSAKNIPATFVEHRYIVFSAYNTAVFSATVLLVSLSVDPSTAMLAHAVGVSIGSTIVVGALTLPRVAVARGWVSAPEDFITGKSTQPSGGKGSSTTEDGSTYEASSSYVASTAKQSDKHDVSYLKPESASTTVHVGTEEEYV